jgi:hypothetical protein
MCHTNISFLVWFVIPTDWLGTTTLQKSSSLRNDKNANVHQLTINVVMDCTQFIMSETSKWVLHTLI